MRADSRPAHEDFPWPTVIRTEMESWFPERLPATFQPRARRRPVSDGRDARRPLALGFAVLIVASFAVGRLTAPPAVRTAVRFVTTTAARLAPAPAPAATAVPAVPARPAPPVQVVPTRPPATPAHVRATAPAPAPATPRPSPGATATPDSGASAQSTPQPNPSPSKLCLPLNLGCL